ncbi:MAG: hypothetical protein IKP88_15410 [Lachnospiraceae bacterium]|nr:hypothetical protein [Lachnospiraceae bacterium]
MKRLLKITLGCAILALFIALTSNDQVFAKFSKKELAPDKTYKYDLDGDGTKEKISYSLTFDGYDLKWAGIDINGKSAYSHKLGKKETFYSATVMIYDINPKDEYKEVIIDYDFEFEHNIKAYRYQDKKLTLLFDTGMLLGGEKLVDVQKKGNKVLMYESATCACGNCFYITTNNKIKNKKLKEVKPKDQIYTIPQEIWGDYLITFNLAKDVEVYKDADGTEVIGTLKKGTEIHLTKLKYNNGTVVYALVDVIGGEESVGWIDVEFKSGMDGDSLVTNPAWAG